MNDINVVNNSYIPYGRQTITSEDINAVEKVLKGEFLTQGKMVPSFENEISTRVLAKHAVAFNSATSALHIACLSLGVGENDYIWTSPISFVASANCGRLCGANVDFVDVHPKTGLINLSLIHI